MSSPHLVVWTVVLPVAVAVALPLVGRATDRVARPLALAALLAQTALATVVTARVAASGPLSYAVGGFPAPYGIELVVDGLGAAVVLLVAVVALAAHAYTWAYGPADDAYHALVLLLAAGLTGIAVTADLFNLYVFLEISGIAAYALVARSAGGVAALAAFRYLVVGTVGATLYLLGVAYAYAATGTLNFADLAVHLADAGLDSSLVVAGFGFIAAGLAVKVALVPAHTWLPDAHSKAPTSVSVLLSSLVTTAAAYALVRLVAAVFTPAFLATNPEFSLLFVVAGVTSVFVGGAAAFRQRTVKRLLAYSTVAQLGLVIAGIGVATEVAVRGAVFHLLGHAVMKCGLFLAAGALAERHGATTVTDYAGLGRREPVLAGAFAVLALGMVGFPPTAGFVGKWYVALGALRAGSWLVVAVVLLSTFLSLAYFGPLLRRLYFDTPNPEAGHEDPYAHAADGGPAHDPIDGHAGGGPARGDASDDESADGPKRVVASLGPVAAAVATLALGLGATALLALVRPALEVFP